MIGAFCLNEKKTENMMKKQIGLLLLFCLVMTCLVACNPKKDEDSETLIYSPENGEQGAVDWSDLGGSNGGGGENNGNSGENNNGGNSNGGNQQEPAGGVESNEQSPDDDGGGWSNMLG